jgi:hypothetical protein
MGRNQSQEGVTAMLTLALLALGAYLVGYGQRMRQEVA